MDTPLVSVHIITYNQECYIAQAIEGALRQKTDFAYEIIIGEDCSTDGTANIVLEYQRKYPDLIRVITSNRNVGALANSRRVRKACRGKYIAYCDGDDFWHHPEKLQRQVNCLEADADVGLVHSDYHLYLHDKAITIKHFNKSGLQQWWSDEKDVFAGILLGRYSIATCTVCVKRTLVMQAYDQERDLFDDRSVVMADLCCWLSISRHCKFFYIDEALSTYRVLAESAAHHKSRMGRVRFDACSKRVRLHFAQKYECPEAVRVAVKASYYRTLLNKAYHANNNDLAKHAFRNVMAIEKHVPLCLWLYFLGGTNRLIKLFILPFMHLRRVILRLQRMVFVSRHGSRGRVNQCKWAYAEPLK